MATVMASHVSCETVGKGSGDGGSKADCRPGIVSWYSAVPHNNSEASWLIEACKCANMPGPHKVPRREADMDGVRAGIERMQLEGDWVDVGETDTPAGRGKGSGQSSPAGGVVSPFGRPRPPAEAKKAGDVVSPFGRPRSSAEGPPACNKKAQLALPAKAMCKSAAGWKPQGQAKPDSQMSMEAHSNNKKKKHNNKRK